MQRRGFAHRTPTNQGIARSLLTAACGLSDALFASILHSSATQFAQYLGLPTHFIEQLFAIEDKRFPYHLGIDPISIFRALIFNMGTKPLRLHGASTLTQQIYSNELRRQGRYRSTLSIKLLQATWAIRTTLRRSKLDVLRDYLASVYFGKHCYGLREAAHVYCDCSPEALTVADSFFLAERIALPNRLNLARISILARRRPIRTVLAADPSILDSLAALYERHFHCGKEIGTCLANTRMR